ncbi:MAG: DUF1896 domain-containing protein [Paludibacter sp.]|nr:DUF1896 domain-containing protein [Paludibacter sp.]
MNKNNEQVELSYYQLTLQSFLEESHPELSNDSDLIVNRGNLASQAYSQAIIDGQTHSQAEELANEVLFKNLHFSKHDTLVNVLWNEFADEVPQGSAKELAQKLLPLCEEVFAGYPLSDDFAFDPQFDQLYTELTGTIVRWFEEHELQ